MMPDPRATCAGCKQAIYQPGPDAPWRVTYGTAEWAAVCPATGEDRGPHHPPQVECKEGHAPGQHNAACMPPADPRNPELRLLRAIFGLCSLCDRADEHDHPDGPPVRVIVDYGLHGPDASNDSYSVCGTWPDVADELRRRLSESAEGVGLHAESLAEAGDYEAAWKARKHEDEMWLLHDQLDNNRRNTPLYEDDPVGWCLTIEQIVNENFPYDVDSGCRIYAFESGEYGAGEDDPELGEAWTPAQYQDGEGTWRHNDGSADYHDDRVVAEYRPGGDDQ